MPLLAKAKSKYKAQPKSKGAEPDKPVPELTQQAVSDGIEQAHIGDDVEWNVTGGNEGETELGDDVEWNVTGGNEGETEQNFWGLLSGDCNTEAADQELPDASEWEAVEVESDELDGLASGFPEERVKAALPMPKRAALPMPKRKATEGDDLDAAESGECESGECSMPDAPTGEHDTAENRWSPSPPRECVEDRSPTSPPSDYVEAAEAQPVEVPMSRSMGCDEPDAAGTGEGRVDDAPKEDSEPVEDVAAEEPRVDEMQTLQSKVTDLLAALQTSSTGSATQRASPKKPAKPAGRAKPQSAPCRSRSRSRASYSSYSYSGSDVDDDGKLSRPPGDLVAPPVVPHAPAGTVVPHAPTGTTNFYAAYPPFAHYGYGMHPGMHPYGARPPVGVHPQYPHGMGYGPHSLGYGYPPVSLGYGPPPPIDPKRSAPIFEPAGHAPSAGDSKQGVAQPASGGRKRSKRKNAQISQPVGQAPSSHGDLRRHAPISEPLGHAPSSGDLKQGVAQSAGGGQKPSAPFRFPTRRTAPLISLHCNAPVSEPVAHAPSSRVDLKQDSAPSSSSGRTPTRIETASSGDRNSTASPSQEQVKQISAPSSSSGRTPTPIETASSDSWNSTGSLSQEQVKQITKYLESVGGKSDIGALGGKFQVKKTQFMSSGFSINGTMVSLPASGRTRGALEIPGLVAGGGGGLVGASQLRKCPQPAGPSVAPTTKKKLLANSCLQIPTLRKGPAGAINTPQLPGPKSERPPLENPWLKRNPSVKIGLQPPRPKNVAPHAPGPKSTSSANGSLRVPVLSKKQMQNARMKGTALQASQTHQEASFQQSEENINLDDIADSDI